MAPGAGDTSNWNTSVHMPELSIGPVQIKEEDICVKNTVVKATRTE